MRGRPLKIGDAVQIKRIELNGCFVKDIWVNATVCIPERSDGVIGVAFKDGSRQMCRKGEWR